MTCQRPQNKNKYVIITLKRFEYDKNELTMKRVDSSGFNVEPKVKIDGKNFSLIGAVLHGGDTIDTGHYIYQTYKKDGNVLKTYDDEYMGNEVYGGDNMTLNLNSYVLLYRNDGDVSPTEAAAPSSVAEAPTEAEESTSTPEEVAAASATVAPEAEESPSSASSPEEAAPVASPEASPTAPIAQQKGKGKIERVVLNDGDGYWIYERFELVNPEWVPNPKSSGGNKKSRKPKDKKIRLRKTRRRKH
jgi:pyruvate/2-oxoglutarate dehydrogenase complex dihydrolipoamide acyltransferase (E2) component